MDDSKFTRQFEQRVKKTIEKYKLFSKKDKILVACSGGKDSNVILYMLKKLGYNVEAITVDAVIGNYTKKNLKNLVGFCKGLDVKLHKISFKKEFGYSLYHIKSLLKSKGVSLKSCTICGVLRRYLLNKYSRGFGAAKIVTGHNLDDEAQSIMMNFFRNTMHLQSRLGPVSGNVKDKKFIPRVKPLYFCSENDVKKYSKMHKFNVFYGKCPCCSDSFRNKIRDILDGIPKDDEVKKNIINNFLKILPKLKKDFSKNKDILSCERCKEPSSENICTTCRIIEKICV